MTEWMDIENAPKVQTGTFSGIATTSVRLLLFVPPYGVTTGNYNSDDERWSCHSVLNREAQPTHWMPLPDSPERLDPKPETE